MEAATSSSGTATPAAVEPTTSTAVPPSTLTKRGTRQASKNQGSKKNEKDFRKRGGACHGDYHRYSPQPPIRPRAAGASYVHPTLFGFQGRVFGCRAVWDRHSLSLRLKRGEEA